MLEDFEEARRLSRRPRAYACAVDSCTCAPAAPAAPVLAPVAAAAPSPVPNGAADSPMGIGVSSPGATREKGRTLPTAVSRIPVLEGSSVVELGV